MKKILVLVTALLTCGSAFGSYVQAPFPTNKGGTGSASQTSSRAVTTDGSGNLVSSSATTATEIGYVNGVTSAIQTQLDAKAVRALSNLASVAINTALLPGSSGAIDLGSNTLLFRDVFITSIKDASSVISVDPINRLLKDAAGATALDYSSTSIKMLILQLLGSTSGHIDVVAPAVSTNHTVTLPATVCSNGQYWADNGSGVMSCVSPSTPLPTVVDGGNAAYTILAGDFHVRSGTTLTAGRAYTLPACTGSNIGEQHEVKNLPAQTFNITVTADGSDNIDGAATFVLAPGDSVSVICAAFSTAGTWDIQ